MKQIVRGILRSMGLEVVRRRPVERILIEKHDTSSLSVVFDSMGENVYHDMRRFIDIESPVILDVGANIGQSIESFISHFPLSIIHSFEPSPETFQELTRRASHLENVSLWNTALGAENETRVLIENVESDMSSFLPIGEQGWGEVKRETSVAVQTIDKFCKQEEIKCVDILKSDTQGFELEVFKGARDFMSQGRVKMVYCEINFGDLYLNLPRPEDIMRYLSDQGFSLVSFYEFSYQKQRASWTDALFVHESATSVE